MKFKLNSNIITLLLSLLSLSLTAQNRGEAGGGYVTGSLESNTIRYAEDKAVPLSANPEDRIGSNNYVKLDYHKGRFSAGVQMEAYLPVLQNYPRELAGTKLTNYYASWTDEDFSVTAGTFYDQLGSGLLFRSYEDRALGLNNAVMGARATYTFRNIVNAKAFIGQPRIGMGIADARVRGADLQFSIGELAGWTDTYLSLEGSVLSRYEKISPVWEELGGRANRIGYSGRVNFDHKGFFVRAEYVDAGKNCRLDKDWIENRGNAQLLEFGYAGNGLGVNLTARRLEWMESRIASAGEFDVTTNSLNYVPALCTQYTYLLTTLHPYIPQTGIASADSGEMGGQLDLFYNFKRRSLIGGKYGMKVHANFSTYYAIKTPGSYTPGSLLFRDLSLDVEKQFTKKYKLILLWSMQKMYDVKLDTDDRMRLQNIFVADMLYKFTPKFSTRLELQYLTTREDEKDWMAALLEVNFAPHWSIWGSDMYNHGSTKIHYYNAGVSYAKSRTRIALGYGRFKEGFLCSGGACRKISAYTGANFTLTTSF